MFKAKYIFLNKVLNVKKKNSATKINVQRKF